MPKVSPCAALGAVCSDSPLGDPTCVFFHVMAPIMVSPFISLVEPSRTSLLCIDLTPGWLSLPQRRPYVVLPLVSPYVISTWYLLYAGCGFRSALDLGMLSQCYSLYRIAVDASLAKPSRIFRPDWYGGLAGFRRALKGVSNSGVFIGILLRQSL